MEDEKIIELFYKRDENALVQTQAKYGKRLLGISHSVLHSRQDSEEVVSDTYGRVWDSVPPQRPVYFFAYLARITKNLAINVYNKNKASKRSAILEELTDVIPAGNNVEDEVSAGELARLIDAWLDSLNKSDRVLFVKRYWFGRSVKDLAQTFGERENHVAVKLHRLRKKLRMLLESEGINV